MGMLPVASLAGAALVPLAAQTWERLSHPSSFLQVLQGSKARSAGAAETAENPQVEAGRGGALGRAGEGERVDRGRAAALERFERLLRQRLSAAGVDTSSPIVLKSDRFGDVMVEDPHPDRSLIEELFASDQALKAAFHRLASEYAAGGIGQPSSSVAALDTFRVRLDQGGLRVSLE